MTWVHETCSLFITGLRIDGIERTEGPFYDMDALASELLSEVTRLLTRINYPLVHSQPVLAMHPVPGCDQLSRI